MRLVGANAGVAAAHHSCPSAYQRGAVGNDGVQSLPHRWEGHFAARKDRSGHRDGHAASSELFQDVGVRVNSLGGEEGAVLDRIHSGGQRIGDPLRAMSMRRDPEPVSVCLVNSRSELRTVVLRLVGSERGGHVPTGCHDLDDIHAVGHPLADRSPTP